MVSTRESAVLTGKQVRSLRRGLLMTKSTDLGVVRRRPHAAFNTAELVLLVVIVLGGHFCNNLRSHNVALASPNAALALRSESRCG